MDLNLPFATARPPINLVDLPELLLHLALKVGLPVDAVKKIRNDFLSWYYQTLTLIGNRRLMHNPYGTSFFIQQKGWSGTQRMVNRRRLLRRYITNLVPWSNEITDLGFFTYDAPRTENNRSGLRIQGSGMMNVPARYRSPF